MTLTTMEKSSEKEGILKQLKRKLVKNTSSKIQETLSQKSDKEDLEKKIINGKESIADIKSNLHLVKSEKVIKRIGTYLEFFALHPELAPKIIVDIHSQVFNLRIGNADESLKKKYTGRSEEEIEDLEVALFGVSP